MTESRTALLVGGTGNLGPLWLEALCKKGVSTTVLDLNPDKLPTSEFQCISSIVECDITRPTQMRNVFKSPTIPDPLDFLIINAGIDSVPRSGGGRRKSKLGLEPRDWLRTLQTNVAGAALTIDLAKSRLEVGSRIILVGSMYGVVSPRLDLYEHMNDGTGWFKSPAYGASKSAVLAITRQYGTHFAGQGILVNAVTFGAVEGSQDEEFKSKIKRQIPTGKLISRNQVLEAMGFALDIPTSMVGQNLVFDGGYTVW